MRGVVHEGIAVQVLGKQLFAKGNAIFLAHLVQPVGLPHGFRRFDNKG